MTRIRGLEVVTVNISPLTNWMFVTLAGDDGLAGYGEASLNGREPEVHAEIERLRPLLVGATVEQADSAASVEFTQPLAVNAARSGVQVALVDLKARSQEQTVSQWLSAAPQTTVRGYANINRRTRDRSPEGCAASARVAVAAGFTAIKIAPFDGVTPNNAGERAGRALIYTGIERIAAIRAAVGAAVDVMVDCHWRFDEPSALAVLRECAALQVNWFECPIPEGPAYYAATKRLRGSANSAGMQLAGAETQVGLAGFGPVIEAGIFDVVMPDMKYCGGFAEIMAIDQLATRHGVKVSPHNPTGPICHLASLHAAAVLKTTPITEHQFDESPLFAALIGNALPAVTDGAFILPATDGLGVALDRVVAAAHPYRPVPLGLEARVAAG